VQVPELAVEGDLDVDLLLARREVVRPVTIAASASPGALDHLEQIVPRPVHAPL
jgi:hypothetical protein